MMHHSGAFRRIDAPETPDEIEAFVARVTAQRDMIAHGDDPAMMAEHRAAHALVDRADATHVAVAHGSWFDPATWAGGEVPGAHARVLIPEGIEVSYDGISNTTLLTVRVDGHLTFATHTDTRMRLDTMFTSMTGHLTVGTEADPVDDGVTADIRFVNRGDIDTGWDPMLLSRGLIAHGTTTIHGAETESHAKVSEDPWAGDTFVTLSDLPEGWEVGDTIVIAGTRFEGFKWSNAAGAHVWHEREDEVRTVTRIEETRDGVTLHFEAPLEHHHHAPRRDLKTSVANMDRSVTISSEDPDAPVHQRGHVMFMHSGDVDVRYAAFDDLGRTDKSVRAFDPEDLGSIPADANLKGRYAVHLHRTGTEDAKDPALLVGNAVSGSPGWGFVQHDSHAILHGNASYDVFGAGYVAETGNETGSWTDNIAIGGTGLNRIVKDGEDVEAFDLGRTGDGFWFQGRMVEASGNVAASVNNGFVYMHRGHDGMIPLEAEGHDFPELFPGSRWVGAQDAPIRAFSDNEAFAAKEGLHIVKSNPNQGHDLHSHLERFTAWEVKSGAHIQYSSHYTLEDFDLVGREESQHNSSRNGISFGNNASDVVIVGGRISGFDDGAIDFNKNFTGSHAVHPLSAHAFVAVDVAFGRGQTPFETFDAGLDRNLAEMPDAVAPRLILDRPLIYREGEDDGARKVAISGTKVDSLGRIPFPAGSDSIEFDRSEVQHILSTDGWFVTPAGKKVFLLEIPITDRLTGEVVKEGHLVEIHDSVQLGERWRGYEDAVYRGVIDPGSRAPVTRADAAETMQGVDVTLDVLANDRDPEGAALAVDGILQPDHGQVFQEADGTLTYRPDLGFAGTDGFAYFAHDGAGNFTREAVTVEVVAPDAEVAVLEVGATLLTDEALTIALQGEYERPVVIATLRTGREADIAVVRLDEVTSDSVTMRLIEPDHLDGAHRPEIVDYMVVEAGTWELSDGTRVSAGIETVAALGDAGAAALETGLAVEDAVFVQHQASRAPGWGMARLSPEEDGWAVGLDVAEAQRDALSRLRFAEEAGWVAFEGAEEGSDLFLFRTLSDVGSDGAAIRGIPGTFGAAGGVHGIASDVEADTAISRADAGRGVRPSLRVQEETSLDAETDHAGEDVHLFVYSDAALDAVHYGVAL